MDDEVKQALVDMTHIVSNYYLGLIEDGVPERTAQEFTNTLIKQIMSKPPDSGLGRLFR
jgi:hypothetical protein